MTMLSAVVLVASLMSWWVALTAIKPLCQAYAATHGLDHEGLSLAFFARGNSVSPCVFRTRDTRQRHIILWRNLHGANPLLRFAVRPDLMSYALGVTGILGWLFLTPHGRALRKKKTPPPP
ncbi:hypothetical protein [Xanthobacter agilis]|uniref:Uncharacterized protein n=2 Tax=Xanthobacter agilis TaxID=47492 RepID=A0ABU0LDD2_XANAG|nr:hypothetical protein [Xanthobacter agilis]MDQ0505093.1 hypothetical protein [Xanthobacter agilis]